MKLLTYISRILVGSLFIVSGIIKANDPLGFSYKLEEYFSANVLNLPFLEPYALAFSMLVCISEVVLGIMVLFGSYARLTSWLLLLMIVFFTFLTFYSAYFNKVTDCGCFGDALKLTPWESFFKDVALLVFILIIFIRSKDIHRNTPKEDLVILPVSLAAIGLFSSGVLGWSFPLLFSAGTLLALALVKRTLTHLRIDLILIIIATAITTYFTLYCYNHLPVKDFRPYAIGKSIKEGRELPPGARPYIYENTFIYKNSLTGEEKEFSEKNYPWQDSTWVFVSRETKLVQKGDDAPIHDFNLISPDGNDYTEDILNEPVIFLLVAYDISKSNEKVQPEINQFVEEVNKAGYYFYGVTASAYNEAEDFRHKHQSMFEYYSADATMLKTVIRSNPGLVLLKNGTVAGKWHYNDFPGFEEVKKLIGE